MEFDAPVVGIGPAGASCAYHLSKSGLKVLLVEKGKLPRFKLCAGCLSARALELLREGSLIEVCRQAEFLGFERESEGYRVFTSRGSFVVDYLVGADGVHSRVAKVLSFKKKNLYKSMELFTDG